MGIREREMKSTNTRRAVLSGWNWGKTVAAVALFGAEAPAAFAHSVATATHGQGAVSHLSLGEAFTFLFVALGPLNVIGPFATFTRGRGAAFKRGLAFRAFLVAAIALLFAATLGAKALEAWGISVGALLLAAGAILFLVALQPVLAGYSPRGGQVQAIPAVPAPSEPELAFSPLAFPTIITPYGLALLILLFTLYPFGSGGLGILAIASFVLALDLLAMLCTDLLAKIPFIKPGLDILGCVMGVLLVALGVQAVADGLRLLGEQRF
jgi:small neutral amino acid transporter SnatA (MarC family)